MRSAALRARSFRVATRSLSDNWGALSSKATGVVDQLASSEGVEASDHLDHHYACAGEAARRHQRGDQAAVVSSALTIRKGVGLVIGLVLRCARKSQKVCASDTSVPLRVTHLSAYVPS